MQPDLPADEFACATALGEARWPEGFRCADPVCGATRAWRLPSRPRVWQCAGCERHHSVTAGTALHGTKLPLRHWFVAAARMMRPGGISARQLARVLCVTVDTAWRLLHKLSAWLGDEGGKAFAGLFEVCLVELPSRPPPGYAKPSRYLGNHPAVVVRSPDTGVAAARKLDGRTRGVLAVARHHGRARGREAFEVSCGLRLEIEGTHRSVGHRWLGFYLSRFEFRANGASSRDLLKKAIEGPKRRWRELVPPRSPEASVRFVPVPRRAYSQATSAYGSSAVALAQQPGAPAL